MPHETRAKHLPDSRNQRSGYNTHCAARRADCCSQATWQSAIVLSSSLLMRSSMTLSAPLQKSHLLHKGRPLRAMVTSENPLCMNLHGTCSASNRRITCDASGITAPLSRIGLLRAGFAESECRDLHYAQCDARQNKSLQSAPAVGDLADYRHSLPVRVELVDVEDFELGSPAHDIDLNLATTIGYQPKSECLGC